MSGNYELLIMNEEGASGRLFLLAEGLPGGVGLFDRLVVFRGVIAGQNLTAQSFFEIGGEAETLRASGSADVKLHAAVGLDGDFDFLSLHGWKIGGG
jgi:hypothetical protein